MCLYDLVTKIIYNDVQAGINNCHLRIVGKDNRLIDMLFNCTTKTLQS